MKQKKEVLQLPNPISLRDLVYNQLKALGWFCSIDAFSDKSGSWIEVYKEDQSKKKEGSIKSFSIQFNWEGTVIQNIQVWESKIVIKKEDAVKIF